jgi:hypothetical protein
MWVWALLSLVLSVGRAETADEIIARARAANQVSSSVQNLRMTITRGSSSKSRDLVLRSRREADGTVKTRMDVASPSDVAGTKLLMIQHPNAPIEQYVYLPATKRLSRLASSQRTGNFLGSDFNYEDLEFRSAAEGSRSITGETPTEWQITTVTGEGSSYSKVVVHMDKANLIAKKVEFYDKKTGTLAKELVVNKIEKDGARNVPVETQMRNIKTGGTTTITIQSHQYDVGKDVLPDETFTPGALEN